MHRFRRGPALSASAVIFALAAAGCATNPATGEKQLILISESQEISMGREYSEQVEASIGLYDDPALQAYVEGIGKQLAASSERPDLPWSFKVVDDPVVNAFALPGGFIYVTRGIITHFSSEGELAAVLGHEIGHVTARHSVEQLSRAQLAQLGLGLGSVFVPEVAQYGDALGFGLNVLFLKFSRDDERQADDLGLRYMRNENYDPREMIDVFTMLNRVTEAAGGSPVPGWLATHPNPEDRRERIAEQIGAAPAAPGGTVARDRYLRRIDGMVFGQNPRQGFFRDGLFMHPDLAFRFEFPSGWKTQNTAQAVAGVSPEQDAMIQLTFAPGASAADAARQFFSQPGLESEGFDRGDVNGLPAVRSYFRAQTQQGLLGGLVVFVEYGGRVYQLLAYTPAARLRAYESTFRRALGSFDRLKDSAALAVQPRRIRIVQLDRSMSLEEFQRAYPSTVSEETLAIINGIEPGGSLPAGRTVKRVVGGDLPDS